VKKFITKLFFILFLLSSPSFAGVVMDLVTKSPTGQEADRTNIFAQSEKIRMDMNADKGSGSRVSMIFLGDQFLILEHSDKSYIVMDEAMLDEVSTQISDAMKQMEAQLANLPPEQRAMMEKMMQGQMQGMMGQHNDPAAGPRIEATGTGRWQSYDCKNYSVYEGAQKTQDICAATLDQLAGGEEMMQAFRRMAVFITKMTESMPMQSNDGLNPGELMDQIGGFPVHTIEYENGQVTAEISLESVTEQDLDEDLFSAPSDYRRQNLFQGR
jgi:hypothetical protein